jgi:hypothetical protein
MSMRICIKVDTNKVKISNSRFLTFNCEVFKETLWYVRYSTVEVINELWTYDANNWSFRIEIIYIVQQRAKKYII